MHSDMNIEGNSCFLFSLSDLPIEFALPNLSLINIFVVSKHCSNKVSNNDSEVQHNRRFVLVI